jgi:hypothetical protein
VRSSVLGWAADSCQSSPPHLLLSHFETAALLVDSVAWILITLPHFVQGERQISLMVTNDCIFWSGVSLRGRNHNLPHPQCSNTPLVTAYVHSSLEIDGFVDMIHLEHSSSAQASSGTLNTFHGSVLNTQSSPDSRYRAPNVIRIKPSTD